MANYKQLSYGATGEEVKQLQEKLNKAGNYNLDTDGIYGDKTKAAVEDYQRANSLSVDGVADSETWGSLDRVQTNIPAQGAETNYSDNVKQAQALLQQHMASKPGDYQSVWQDEADALLKQYQDRGPFSYDANADPLYQQLKDNYIQQGQMAMMDTMGQAAALTGGYGSSYGQAVGQQAYNQQLTNLNAMIPELYQTALDQYNQEGQNMLTQYGLYVDRESQDYGRYQDALSHYYTELDRLTDDARYQEEFAYQKERDEVEDEWRQIEFDEAKRLADQQYALSLQNSYRSSGSSGPTYTTLTFEEQAKWMPEFENAKDVAGVEWVADNMEAAGIDPVEVARWVDYYTDLLLKKQKPVDPHNPPVGMVGGGGGYKSIVDRLTY